MSGVLLGLLCALSCALSCGNGAGSPATEGSDAGEAGSPGIAEAVGGDAASNVGGGAAGAAEGGTAGYVGAGGVAGYVGAGGAAGEASGSTGSCAEVALSISPAAPQLVGTELMLTAHATCVDGEPEYRFLHQDPLADDYLEVGPWSDAASLKLTSNAWPAGVQLFLVEARAQASGDDRQASATASYLLNAVCEPGYHNDLSGGCADIDECETDNGGCDPLTECFNDVGSFSCSACPSGYGGSGAAGCKDIDECKTNNGGCDPLSKCTNSAGSFSCGPDPVTLLAAGDVGDCTVTTDTATGLLLGANAGTVAVLGDIGYPHGTAANFTDCFDPSWGAYKARLKPVPGNHEYEQTDAAPYYAYFGAAAGDPSKGYYSYDLGAWHIVALNSNCSDVSCAASSAQETWLRQDLAANPTACTLAYWHEPRFSSGEHGNASAVAALFKALVDYGVELLLAGHDHDYERFAAQNQNAVASASGVVQFVVGTGGTSLRPFDTIRANSLVRQSSANGLLKLRLGQGAYAWEFLPVAGKNFSDSGTAACH